MSHRFVLASRSSEQFLVASQWTLMWWKFRKHKVAVFCMWVLVLFYLAAIFCEFVSPADPHKRNSRHIYAPPRKLHFIGEDGFHLRPFVYSLKGGYLDENWTRRYEEDRSRVLKVRFFVSGDPYKLWGLIPWDRHLFGVEEPGEPLLLVGADHFGRDMLSLVIYGSRVSLSIGLVGVFLSLMLGCVMGGISGYFGGAVDNVIQRVIELLMSLPTLPLWMGLGAALPHTWSPL